MERFTLRTGQRSDFIDITARVQDVLARLDITEGMCHVFIPHTTAGVTINENADPSVRDDLIAILDRLVPWTGGYRHTEGNSASHMKATLTGFTATIPVSQGRLVLGTWQGIYFCEFDGPRNRTVLVSATRA